MAHYQAKMSSKGQLATPSAVREHFNLKTGDIVDFYDDDARPVSADLGQGQEHF